jgi:hypothetical protein
MTTDQFLTLKYPMALVLVVLAAFLLGLVF